MDIYSNKSIFKIIILFVALSIGFASIVYTRVLVKNLELREKKMIDLYAKGLQYAVDPNNNADLSFLFQEILDSNSTIPVILTDEKQQPLSYLNIDLDEKLPEEVKQKILKSEIESMKNTYPPIVIEYKDFGFKNFIYYKNSKFLNQLRYYPYIQLSIIAALAIIAYLAFSYSRRAEQNRVWVGMAKETAHQLGTPLSSLMAWVEILRDKPENKEMVEELEKDIQRLEMITSRFSNIGSEPSLIETSIRSTVYEIVDYLKKRTSPKVHFNIEDKLPEGYLVKINAHLLGWAIENICKNAVDAMDGQGSITISLQLNESNRVLMDIHDTGKGIPKSKFKTIFKPGYTTKKRGWGLGLTLVKRIIENYHSGKITVHQSDAQKGTTFRILL